MYYQNNSEILTMTGFLLGHALKVTCLGFVCLRCNQPVFQANTDKFFSKRAFEPGTKGSLVSKSFSLWLTSPKMVAESVPLAFSL